MLLGLDVGGTHTDAVLIDNSRVVKYHKAVTDHENLAASIIDAIGNITRDIDISSIKRINLSTTLSTNAIVQERVDDVGVIVSAGPGIDPENFRIGNSYFTLPGSIDHRGSERKGIDSGSLKRVIEECRYRNIDLFAVVTKFSTRNPCQENLIEKELGHTIDFVTLGHTISGQLSFPRRIATAYYNSAVWRTYNNFAKSIQRGIEELGIEPETNILKADGGTMPFNISLNLPVESILSGPAASIMGIIALCSIEDDSIVLDIGGTTTDISIFSSGSPLLEREGIVINERPTLIRALQNRSIGIGGDSLIKSVDGVITVGPEREGPAAADGGDRATLVDALNLLGKGEHGDLEASKRAVSGLAASLGSTPEELSGAAADYAVNRIAEEVEAMVKDINNRPVYTIHEMIEGKDIVPEKIFVMGGPAASFTDHLKERFSLDVEVPDNYQVANAIGAALARTTFEIELFADTGKGKMIVPNLTIENSVSESYSLDDAKKDAVEILSKYLDEQNIQTDESLLEITEASSFNMVSGFYSSGKDIRVKCQLKPGVIDTIK
jgi:N-methylhydantoinase A/oxoprolinase/acetone carboxylase beta subunit